ncbi:hypothetical protein D0B54_11765 [Solimonas sp. K1W22B-7]|uniref:hypothetical protein n=1 Tax=Solimonas sp. K1W22B-7 TaxID=2303331 RepID=UPI000E334D38|nr:hypothetical protein [Solimonas sp. K1W22B-7]AXQ29325.1 hypothetical protein D0B54_11765 [Solimonas sp. K1W22B-7]
MDVYALIFRSSASALLEKIDEDSSCIPAFTTAEAAFHYLSSRIDESASELLEVRPLDLETVLASKKSRPGHAVYLDIRWGPAEGFAGAAH